MQTTFPTGEPNCSMCMNLNKDPVCPVCRKENLFRGNQPVGCMTWRSESYSSLPGYEKFGTILLTFNFDSGIQGIIKLILLANIWENGFRTLSSQKNCTLYLSVRKNKKNTRYKNLLGFLACALKTPQESVGIFSEIPTYLHIIVVTKH